MPPADFGPDVTDLTDASEHMFDTSDQRPSTTREELVDEIDRSNAEICRSQRRMLELIARADERAVWTDSGAMSMSHYVSMRYGVSWWKAERWIRAGHALRSLPRIAGAFERGEIGIDKVLELCRFATPETEARLLRWAGEVSAATIRRRGDLEVRRSREEAEQAERARSVNIWYADEGTMGELLARLPAAEMAVVEQCLDRVADRLPTMPDEDPNGPERLADALVAVCRGSADPTPTILIHAPAEALLSDDRSARVGFEGVVVGAALQRLACEARLQVVAEDGAGNPLALGRARREPPASMLRLLRHRDPECRFPGCGRRSYLKAHHIKWWSRGGRTDLDNLLMICTFHHRLVHEHGWRIERAADGAVAWYRPDGTKYRAGPPGLPDLPADVLERFERYRANCGRTPMLRTPVPAG